MKKRYSTPSTHITPYEITQILAGTMTINPGGSGQQPITPGDGDGGGDPGSFSNKGLWDEEETYH